MIVTDTLVDSPLALDLRTCRYSVCKSYKYSIRSGCTDVPLLSLWRSDRTTNT